MKKRAITFASILCLVLIVFALASCSNGKKPAQTDGTAPVTTAATTTGDAEHVHVWDTEYTVDAAATCVAPGTESIHCTDPTCNAIKPDSSREIAKLDHVWNETYTVDTAATCVAAGEESIHCSNPKCTAIKPDSSRPIPAGDGHQVAEWIDDSAASILSNGHRHGECTLCHEPVEEEIVSVPAVYNTSWSKAERAAYQYPIPDSDTGISFGKNTFQIKTVVKKLRYTDRDDTLPENEVAHFYPDESNGYLGNDLLVEFSFLYNETMVNASDPILAVMYIEDNNIFNINLATGKIISRERTGDVFITPTPAEIEADATAKEIPIGEYGWHRFGMRIHQDAINNGGEEDYKITATAYLDGNEILKVDKTTWVKTYKSSYTGKLFHATPTSVDGDEFTYIDINQGLAAGDGSLKQKHCDVYVEIEGTGVSANAGYLVVADLYLSCGRDFVQNVTAVAAPADAPQFVLDDKGTADTADDVTCPGKIYYSFVD